MFTKRKYIMSLVMFIFALAATLWQESHLLRTVQPSWPQFPTELLESNKGGGPKDDLTFGWENPVDKFPLPEGWLSEMMKSQPSETHHEDLLNPDNKFIILTCHKYERTKTEACGGLADRLRLIPYYLMVAKNFGRKLLIKHSHPAPLEEWLVPPANGFDWTLPDGYEEFDRAFEAYANRSFEEYKVQRWHRWHKKLNKPEHNDTRIIFINANLGLEIKERIYIKETTYKPHEIWPGIFHCMFQPSPPLAKALTEITRTLGLKPGEYSAAHVRARYPTPKKMIKFNNKNWDKGGGGIDMSDPPTAEYVHELSDNAVKCAAIGQPDLKHVYVASDSFEVPQYLVEESPQWSRNSNSSVTVVGRTNYTIESPHFGGPKMGEPPVYYPTFIDFLIMSHAKCVSHGLGGYGLFVSQLSGSHYTCGRLHRDRNTGILPSCPRQGSNSSCTTQLCSF